MNGEIYAGGVSAAGDILFGKAGSVVTLHSGFELDDHDNPSILRRTDGHIVVSYSRHGGGSNYYQRISTNPDDFSTFGAETNIGAALGASNYTYANLVEINDGIFNFVRCLTTGGFVSPHYTISTNGGSTWSPVQKLLNGQRPYMKVCRNGANRIDIVCTDGHPNEIATSIWHFYYSGGSFYKSDGTPLGAPPFNVSNLTRIYNGSTVKGWMWDVRPDPQGRPVVVYATFPTELTDHRYNYAKWSGSAWVGHEICAAGGTIYPIGDDSEQFYSGGICIDPSNVNTIYCSRETGSGGSHRNGGTFQLWRTDTRNEGLTWTLTRLLTSADDCIRPVKLAGANKLLFVRGVYTSWTNFATSIASLTL